MNYYNEIDPYCVQWLENLIAAGEIPKGVVDSRSIVDVRPSDVAGFTQCHFFAGVAGWSIAAKLAGWSCDRGLWSGSPPCQSYSVSGLQLGMDDPRDLWPHYFRLIAACRPDVVVGEQVAAAIVKHWLDRMFADLESIDYANQQRTQIQVARDIAAIQVTRGHLHSYWQGATPLACHDGRTRRHEPRLSLLVDGLPAAMAASCAFGNAIVPQVAAEVLGAWMECAP